MKNLLLGLCLVGLTFACKGTDKMNVDDAGNPTMPAAECGAGECEDMTECSGDMKAECSSMKAECSSMKAECSASTAECSGAAADCSGAAAADCAGDKPCCADNKPADAVCPVTGKPIN